MLFGGFIRIVNRVNANSFLHIFYSFLQYITEVPNLPIFHNLWNNKIIKFYFILNLIKLKGIWLSYIQILSCLPIAIICLQKLGIPLYEAIEIIVQDVSTKFSQLIRYSWNCYQ